MENKGSFNNQGYEVEAIGPFPEQALGPDQILKVTALLYFKEALVAQKYESCQELIDTAKNLGADSGDISAVIAEYLNADNPGRQKGNRLRS